MASPGDIIVLKPDSSTDLQGSGQINIPGANLTHGVRLSEMPSYTITTEFDITRPVTPGIGNATIHPVVCKLTVDQSTVDAFKCLVAGINLQNVSIWKLTTTGSTLKVFTRVVLSNTFIEEWSVSFDTNLDRITGEGLQASYTFVCNAITQIINATDSDGNPTGSDGSEVQPGIQTSQQSS